MDISAKYHQKSNSLSLLKPHYFWWKFFVCKRYHHIIPNRLTRSSWMPSCHNKEKPTGGGGHTEFEVQCALMMLGSGLLGTTTCFQTEQLNLTWRKMRCVMQSPKPVNHLGNVQSLTQKKFVRIQGVTLWPTLWKTALSLLMWECVSVVSPTNVHMICMGN